MQVPILAHAATKGAVVAMTRQLAAEGAPHGIRAVSIGPGTIETPGTAATLADPAVRTGLPSQALAPRLGTLSSDSGNRRWAGRRASGDLSGLTWPQMIRDGLSLSRVGDWKRSSQSGRRVGLYAGFCHPVASRLPGRRPSI